MLSVADGQIACNNIHVSGKTYFTSVVSTTATVRRLLCMHQNPDPNDMLILTWIFATASSILANIRSECLFWWGKEIANLQYSQGFASANANCDSNCDCRAFLRIFAFAAPLGRRPGVTYREEKDFRRKKHEKGVSTRVGPTRSNSVGVLIRWSDEFKWSC